MIPVGWTVRGGTVTVDMVIVGMGIGRGSASTADSRPPIGFAWANSEWYDSLAGDCGRPVLNIAAVGIHGGSASTADRGSRPDRHGAVGCGCRRWVVGVGHALNKAYEQYEGRSLCRWTKVTNGHVPIGYSSRNHGG